MPRCLPMLTSFFDRFLIRFCSHLRPLEPQESSPRCSESTIYQKIAFRILHRFFIDFGANMLRFSFQKTTKIASKIDLGRHQFFDRFLHQFFIDFCSIWEANLAPCWRHFRSKWSDAVEGRLVFCWVYVLFRFFGRPGPVLAPFGLDLGGSGARFWMVFGLDFGRCWARFCKFLMTGLSIRSAGVCFWMRWWGYAKRKEFAKAFKNLRKT